MSALALVITPRFDFRWYDHGCAVREAANGIAWDSHLVSAASENCYGAAALCRLSRDQSFVSAVEALLCWVRS